MLEWAALQAQDRSGIIPMEKPWLIQSGMGRFGSNLKGDAMKILVLAVVLALVLTRTSDVLAAQYAPQVGQPHVDFTLPDIQQRKAYSLAQYRGKKVLLIQFASW